MNMILAKIYYQKKDYELFIHSLFILTVQKI